MQSECGRFSIMNANGNSSKVKFLNFKPTREPNKLIEFQRKQEAWNVGDKKHRTVIPTFSFQFN